MLSFLISYVKWHYGRAYIELFSIMRGYISFLFHFFSISILFRTLFSRWQMLGEPYKKRLDIGLLIGTFVLNTTMRIFGFVVRTLVIIVGVISIVIAAVLSIFGIILWTVAPLIVIVFFVSGLRLLFK